MVANSGRWCWPPLAVILGVAACGSDDEPSEVALRAQAVLDETRVLSDQVRDVEDLLVQRCMTDAGFTVMPPTPEALPDGAGHDSGVSPTVEIAQRDGYALSTLVSATGEPDEDSAWSKLGEAEVAAHTLAMFGPEDAQIEYRTEEVTVSISREGCSGEVRRALYGDMDEYVRLSWIAGNEVHSATSANVDSNKQWRDSLAEWSTCMTESGYPGLRHPSDAFEAAAQLYETNTETNDAMAHELNIAQADAGCAEQTGLNHAFRAARAAANEQALVTYEGDLVAWREHLVSAAERAGELLDGQ
ncbi:hypothetical protein [Phytoactinopolyspora limicola]|uniref:hypothetical protein n=1 Tax=Phytoactinopolyspora limicola TaxID=2715536 RepID=UPI00140C0C9F|nr:hypothetical protein [Phytoactinopolyspora limicola]